MAPADPVQVLQDLTAEVARQTTVDDSASTLITQLVAKIAAANAISPDAVQAVLDQIKANNDALTAAVTANTPTA